MKIIARYRVELVKDSNCKYDIDSKRISSPDDAYRIIEEIFRMSVQAEEIFVMLVLDSKNNIVGSFEVSRGSLNSSIVHPREVFKRALLLNASSIVIAHNHPSGESEPSHEDIVLTNRIDECGKLLGIKVIDHIITGDYFYSFKEEGMI